MMKRFESSKSGVAQALENQSKIEILLQHIFRFLRISLEMEVQDEADKKSIFLMGTKDHN